MLSFIQDTVYQTTGKTGVTEETDFVQDLGLNSFEVMNIICTFEDHFQIEIPNRDVWQLHRARDVMDYLAQLGFTEP